MYRVGTGVDAHRFDDARALVLGGVEIPEGPGLRGHSDADVLTHAIMDAMLGAVAAGDIGTLFPDTDERWRDAVSLSLLEQVAAQLASLGWTVVNVDATVIAESPKLARYMVSMRECLAQTIGIAVADVSVKATTVERMGALGRKEGMAAQAVVMVRRQD